VSFGRVDAAGVVTELGWVSQAALWSGDGRRAVDRVLTASTGAARIDVTTPVTGETVTLGLPSAADWQVLAWEDDSHVLAAREQTSDTGAPSYFSVVRCDASTGTCERVRQGAAIG
jgi:hypothetical protein